MKMITPLGGEDDFIVPENQETSISCSEMSDIANYQTLLPVTASLSIVCYIYLFWMYFGLNSPIFKRHPTTLAIYRCILEVIFVQQYLWLPFLNTSQLYSSGYSSEPYHCIASNLSAWLAFFTQFSLLGSELCFLIISLDLRLAYTNPFSSYKQNRIKYVALVIGVSLVSSVLLILCGHQVYGLSELGIVWVQSRRKHHSPNYPKAFLFYGWNVAIFVYCIWANFQFYRGSEKGFSKTVSNRLSIMRRSKRYTAAYVVYETAVLLIEFISFIMETNPNHGGPLPAYFYSLRGVCGLLIIVYSNYTELTWEDMNPFRLRANESEVANVAKERLLLQPHLNSALRAEILYFTTQGIRFAAKEFDQRKNIRSLASPQANALLDAARKNHKDNQGQGNNQQNEQQPDEMIDEERLYSFDAKGLRPSESLNPSLGGSIATGGQLRPQSFLRGIRKSLGGNANNITSEHPSITNNNNNNDEDDEEERFMRETMSNIEELEKRQENALNRVREVALLDEVENIGYTASSFTTSSKFNEPAESSKKRGGVPPSGSNKTIPVVSLQAGGGGGGNEVDSDFGEELSPELETASNVNNPLFAGRSSFLNGKQSKSQVPASQQQDENVFEMSNRSSFQNRQSNNSLNEANNNNNLPHRAISAESQSSDSTVKWRDTMDVEFGIRYSNHTAGRNSEGGAGDMPSWRRLKHPSTNGAAGPGNNSNTLFGGGGSTNYRNNQKSRSVGGRLATHSEESDHSSQSSSTIQRVIETAKAAAQSFFNNAYKEFRFKDFCPKLFARVRELHGITAKEYAESFEITCRERFSEGRSGAFMFFSGNQKCIVKTTSKSELLSLHRIMPQYVEFLEMNPDSLLVRFVGAHCITMYGNEIYFVVMLNVFPTVPLSERYDLKGSWVNRHGFQGSRRTRSERLRREQVDACPLYQDNDLQHSISLEADTAINLALQIKRDILFLESCNFMDYSLLIGVRREKFRVLHQNQNASPKNAATTAGATTAVVAGNNIGTDKNSLLGPGPLSMSPSPSIISPNASLSAASSLTGGGSIVNPTTTNPTNAPIIEDHLPVVISQIPRPPELQVGGVDDGGMNWRLISKDGADTFSRDLDGGIKAKMVEGPGTYYIGIIDVLQEWNLTKRLERFFKIYFKFVDPKGISAVPPTFYAQRFWKRCILDVFEGVENLEADLFPEEETASGKKIQNKHLSLGAGKHGGLTNYDMKRKALEDSLKSIHSRPTDQYEEGVV